ncbi:MAG: hypothetical protein Q8P18_06965 [Pseudomonadota bacterium]|nr:hypothetical protein [Pseudomonadota bacterium]
MRVLSWLGLVVVVMFTGAFVWQVSSFLAAAVLASIAGWGWSTRDRVPGVQGKTSLVCALGMGSLYFSAVFNEVAKTLALTDLGAAQLLMVGSMLFMVPGLAACVYASRTLARGKGRSGWLGLLGLFNVVGYAIVLFVPPVRTEESVAPAPPG